ncbi:urease accessory protein UreF [Pseudobacillus wudalianchiensis]|uniref:Urease accessory protein UreF n=1 Tax=Pseudobacillus wudalianchiensis TaxID=1743143 RepID=A0A1B9AE74_9BACI|nr:urease accessory UreF family protein [Bacillus wudalianchiensis]OCA82149.1 hypothetical protein A8F95_15770 [Bacillus wudalianchiensis]
MTNEWKIFQLIDSALPTGAFSHSFGLETAFQEGEITSPETLYEWAYHYITGSLAPTEGIATFITYQTVQNRWNEEELSKSIQSDLQRLDKKLTISKMPSESREGGIKLGKRYLKIVNTLYPSAGLSQYADWIKEKRCYGNSSIVHGWISAYLEVSSSTAVFTYLYSNINNLLQSALRLTAVGQTDIQVILQKLHPLLIKEAEKIHNRSYTEDDLYSYAIIQEIQGMRHEMLYSRLFMS